MRIIFFGTPDFAVPALKAILELALLNISLAETTQKTLKSWQIMPLTGISQNISIKMINIFIC